MSDKILRALMHLFALVANTERLTAQSRNIVAAFLKHQLNQNFVEKYLAVFDEFLNTYSPTADEGKQRKRISVSSVKILKICTDINRELNQRQKYIVLLRLLEFLYSSNEPVTDQESEFAKTVSEVFNISEEEFNACSVIVSGKGVSHDSPLFLIIDSRSDFSLEKTKHLYHETMQGVLWILYLKSADFFFLKYAGDHELYLNGQILSPGILYVFNQGSVIRSTKTDAIYYSDVMRCFLEETVESKISFQVRDLEFRFAGGNTGLHRLNFNSSSGDLIGIMGSSGAGKSTLLNLLNGNLVPTVGEVLVNSFDLHREKKKLEGIIGFVPQDDLLIEDLSVFQNLFYNSKLCFAQESNEAINEKVNSLLESLGLYEAKDLKVGNAMDKTISGGQRKRLNIALELIRQPPILFVDEPTSGLSSRDSENVMDLMKQLSISGKLVFVVIHQPSSDIFKLFDKLLLLDTGGYPIYFGNPSDSLIYFKRLAHFANSEESECHTCGNINPEQLFSIIEAKVLDEFGQEQNDRKTSPSEWNQHFISQENPEKAGSSELKNNFRKPSLLKQFSVFIKRDVLSKLSNRQYLLINLLEAPALAIILSYLLKYNKPGADYTFFENINLPAYLFLTVIVALFLGLTVSAEEIYRDRKILKRESFLNLSRGSYLLSKISLMFLLSAIQSFLFVLIGNSILEIKGMYFDYWLIMFATSCFANMMGLNISSAFNSAVTIYILIPLLIIPQILLSGVIVRFDKLNPDITSQADVPILGELMVSRWAFEALAVNQFKENEFEKKFFTLDKKMSQASFETKFRINKLEDKVQLCEVLVSAGKNGTELKENLEFIREELKSENLHPKTSFSNLNNLTTQNFSKELAKETKSYLKKLNEYYIDQYNEASNAKDNLILKFQNTEADIEKFNRQQQDYTNEALEELVLNNNDKVQILENDNRIIQRYQPVFMDGSRKSFIRSGFYVSRKNVFTQLHETFTVNTLFIWFMSLLLIVALYFDVLKKGLSFVERVFQKH